MPPTITIIKSNRRSISLHIEPNGEVLVKAPKLMFDFQIRRFVEQHAEWIEKHSAKRRAGIRKEKDEYFYLGRILKFVAGEYKEISATDTELHFPIGLLFRKEKELTNWYIKEASKIISQQCEYYGEKMKTGFKEITFSDTKSQWGRCTHDNRLQFNWRLVMAPLIVINYVVIHELSHTMEKNHTQMFWMKVRSQNPSYRQQIKWLKENGAGLKV